MVPGPGPTKKRRAAVGIRSHGEGNVSNETKAERTQNFAGFWNEMVSDIQSAMSNGGCRGKKNLWMMNKTCSEKIHLLCQKLHFKSLSGLLNWILFNVDGGSPLLPIHKNSQTLPMKKSRKKNFDQVIRDFEDLLVKRYKPALKRSTNLLKCLRTALKLTKEVMTAEGNTESISDNQAMMHLTSLLSGNRSGIQLNPTKCLDQKWVAPLARQLQAKNQRSSNKPYRWVRSQLESGMSFRQVNLLSQKKGGPLFKGARPSDRTMFKTKTMVTQSMKARTGIKVHAAGSGAFISVPEASKMLIQSCFSECPNLTKENPFDKMDETVRKDPVKLYLLVSVDAARNEGTISTHLTVGFRMLPRLAISDQSSISRTSLDCGGGLLNMAKKFKINLSDQTRLFHSKVEVICDIETNPCFTNIGNKVMGIAAGNDTYTTVHSTFGHFETRCSSITEQELSSLNTDALKHLMEGWGHNCTGMSKESMLKYCKNFICQRDINSTKQIPLHRKMDEFNSSEDVKPFDIFPLINGPDGEGTSLNIPSSADSSQTVPAILCAICCMDMSGYWHFLNMTHSFTCKGNDHKSFCPWCKDACPCQRGNPFEMKQITEEGTTLRTLASDLKAPPEILLLANIADDEINNQRNTVVTCRHQKSTIDSIRLGGGAAVGAGGRVTIDKERALDAELPLRAWVRVLRAERFGLEGKDTRGLCGLDPMKLLPCWSHGATRLVIALCEMLIEMCVEQKCIAILNQALNPPEGSTYFEKFDFKAVEQKSSPESGTKRKRGHEPLSLQFNDAYRMTIILGGVIEKHVIDGCTNYTAPTDWPLRAVLAAMKSKPAEFLHQLMEIWYLLFQVVNVMVKTVPSENDIESFAFNAHALAFKWQTIGFKSRKNPFYLHVIEKHGDRFLQEYRSFRLTANDTAERMQKEMNLASRNSTHRGASGPKPLKHSGAQREARKEPQDEKLDLKHDCCGRGAAIRDLVSRLMFEWGDYFVPEAVADANVHQFTGKMHDFMSTSAVCDTMSMDEVVDEHGSADQTPRKKLTLIPELKSSKALLEARQNLQTLLTGIVLESRAVPMHIAYEDEAIDDAEWGTGA